MKLLAIVWVNLLRFGRERSNIFFALVFPLLLIYVLGLQFGDEDTTQIGLHGDSAVADAVVERLDDVGAVEVQRVASYEELVDVVERGQLPFGASVDDDAGEVLAAGDPLPVTFVYGPPEDVGTIENVVTQAFAAEATVPGVAADLAQASGQSMAEIEPLVEQVETQLPAPEVVVETTSGDDGSGLDAQDQMAVGMLLLMVFLNTMAASTALITSRQLGISRRMLGTPTTTPTIILGEGAGRWLLGIFQGVYIVVATVALFDMEWGHLPSVMVVLALFAAVGAGAALLIGAVMSSESQAGGISVLTALALGALGGSMLPLDLFNATMRTVAHITPHAWALDAFAVLTRHGGTVADILPELAILAGYAVVLTGLAAWRLRVTLSRG